MRNDDLWNHAWEPIAKPAGRAIAKMMEDLKASDRRKRAISEFQHDHKAKPYKASERAIMGHIEGV